MATRAPKAAPRIPVMDKVDKYTELGQRLRVCANCLQTPAERLLHILRLVLTLVTGITHTSPDAQDAVCPILCQHLLARRNLGHAADGGRMLARVQELCSFDPEEAPRRLQWDQTGQTWARLHVKMVPEARIKTRKLGREGYVKIHLHGGGSVVLMPDPLSSLRDRTPATSTTCLPTAAAAASSAATPAVVAGAAPCASTSALDNTPSTAFLFASSAGNAPAVVKGEGEEYIFSLPSLVLLHPTSSSCSLAIKGDVTVSCASTGWSASVTVNEDGRVTGHMDHQDTIKAAKPSGKGSSSLGTLSGHIYEEVIFTASDGAGRGIVFQGVAALAALSGSRVHHGLAALGHPVNSFDLADPPPMLLPRLWSAILDSIMFSNPTTAKGRGAVDLSRALITHLNGFPLDSANVVGPGGSAARASVATGSKLHDDSDDELLMGGPSDQTAKVASTSVKPNVPPCILMEHASGRRHTYQLQLEVASLPCDMDMNAMCDLLHKRSNSAVGISA